MLIIDEPITREIPHEPGETVDFKRLSWRELRDARRIAQAEQRQVLRELGGDLMKAILEAEDGDEEGERRIQRAKRRLQNDESNFDTEAILTLSIAGWSYDQPVTKESRDRLDERTAMWIKQTAIDLTVGEEEEPVGED